MASKDAVDASSPAIDGATWASCIGSLKEWSDQLTALERIRDSTLLSSVDFDERVLTRCNEQLPSPSSLTFTSSFYSSSVRHFSHSLFFFPPTHIARPSSLLLFLSLSLPLSFAPRPSPSPSSQTDISAVPLQLCHSLGFWSVPATAVAAAVFCGVDSAAEQLSDPFGCERAFYPRLFLVLDALQS
jgi:hypothetical protein